MSAYFTKFKIVFFSVITFISNTVVAQISKLTASNAAPISLQATINKWEKTDNKNCLHIKTIIQNNTADTITYVNWSCSWAEAYTCSKPELMVQLNDCEKNYPLRIKIPPFGKEERNIILASLYDISTLKSQITKIGVNFITASKKDDAFKIVAQLPKMQSILWSNDIVIK